jgi:hypothetical protein
MNKRLSSSFRDPSGFMFCSEGEFYRQVQRSYQSTYELFLHSGLYQKLCDLEYLIPHQEVQKVYPGVEGGGESSAYKVLKPERIPFISYPYEWCFSQLKDAALLSLSIQKLALSYGMSLKDGSAYNVQFFRGKPIFIDSLSFEPYLEGKPWVAYRQFCQHFLAPLALMCYRDIRLNELFLSHSEGIPLDLATNLLPWYSRFKLPLYFHLYLHRKAQERWSSRKEATALASQKFFSRFSFLALIDHLETGIQSLRWNPPASLWSEYYATNATETTTTTITTTTTTRTSEEASYSLAGFEYKKKVLLELLAEKRPQEVWDLGANTGLLSRLASTQGIFTLAFDADPLAVEKNYQEVSKKAEKALLPLRMDCSTPSPAVGWAQEERLSFLERGPAEVVWALALVHHLVFSSGISLERIAYFFARCARQLWIEFIPKEDPQVQKLVASRPVLGIHYELQHFEKVFQVYFCIEKKIPLLPGLRTLYVMQLSKIC